MKLLYGLTLLSVLPILLIKFYTKIDTEFRDKLQLNSKDIIIILFSSFFITVTYYYRVEDSKYFFHSIALLAYLVFMSYTDQKTKLLYSSISVIAIIVELISVYKYLYGNNFNVLNMHYTVFILPIVFSIMSIFRLIGFGDVLIYIVISLFLFQFRFVPTISMILNVLITNILFIISSLIMRKREKNQPLTLYITISTFICNLLLI